MSVADLKPPAAVAKNAAKGLELREKHGRGGTEVGVARARQLKARETLSEDDVKSMASYFARHAVDKDGKDFDNPDKPSAGYIAWMLWGGDAAKDWVEGVRKRQAS
jgi:hypothetical protein